MATEQLGEYEFDYSGVRMTDVDGWGAYVAIYGPSPNPMHRNPIFHTQRVAVGAVFHSQEEAAAEAHKVALAMLESGSHHGRPGV